MIKNWNRMFIIIKGIIKRIPGVLWVHLRICQYLRFRRFPGSAAYWEGRYSAGGTSGVGSYGKLAEFKASVLNRFVAENEISSVIEFGCGDGNQLLYAKYPRYIGLDVARKAILLCREKFQNDDTKSFFFYDPECFIDGLGVLSTDLALSLDVLFHLVEDQVFTRYMELLFQAGQRFVIIYSSNFDEITPSAHEREREFTNYVVEHFPQWELIAKIGNLWPVSKYPAPLGSLADFYIYKRKDFILRTE